MKVAGIIAEYNPFHNGHKYQLEQVRKRTDADYIFCNVVFLPCQTSIRVPGWHSLLVRILY